MATSITCRWCKGFLINPNMVEVETGICDQCEEEINGWGED